VLTGGFVKRFTVLSALRIAVKPKEVGQISIHLPRTTEAPPIFRRRLSNLKKLPLCRLSARFNYPGHI
jgi:hypothetical protein